VRYTRLAGVAVVALLGCSGWLPWVTAGAAGAATTAGAATAIAQPTPPVSAGSFPEEPAGAVPSDGDGLIPNPQTPTGAATAPPSSCTVTFSATAGATSATVNAWLTANQDVISGLTVVCLAGTFHQPLHVWNKTSTALLEIAPEPSQSAVLDLGQVAPSDPDPNQYWSDAGGMSIVDSRSVEVYGLTIEHYTSDGTGEDPAGIYVTVRSDTTNANQGATPHLSACFTDGGSCSDIYLIDNTVTAITNTADSDSTDRQLCGNANVDAYGIAVITAGSAPSEALQHVVVEGNTVTGTRTGQSETVTLNGDLTDFLVADNVVHDVDNIGIDTIGWETGANQANHGLLQGNTVSDVDTYSNMAYGRWNGTSCQPRPENAAGIYDDGGSYIEISDNQVWNTDQGINLDVETARRETDHLLVAGNVVHDDPGASSADPSTGTEPSGIGGSSTVAGHDFVALYVDAFGKRSSISDVYVHDNVVQNESQYYLTPTSGMPVVDIGGRWTGIEVWHNQIEGLGASDRDNPLVEIDHRPAKGGSVVFDCNAYSGLSSASSTVNGNFAMPTRSWLTLAQWQAGNKNGWDAHSAVGGFSPSCPSTSLP
jgi:hypothetical protein